MIKKYKNIIATVASLAIIGFLVFNFTKVKNIQVENSQNCLTSEIAQEKTQTISRNIFLVSENNISASLKDISCAGSLKVQKKYPSTMVIHLEIKPVIVDVADTDIGITEDGIFIKNTKASTRPKIYLPQDVSAIVNTKVEDPKIIFALSLVKNLLKSDFTPTQVRFIDNADIIIYSQSEAAATFTVNRDAKEQVDSLQSVLSKARIDASKISQIDVRFDKPVVTYKK